MNQPLFNPGQLFAERYRIERFLAQGGFGAVYVAEQLATEAKVALKVLWPHVLASADVVEKFKLEARVAARVDSDHVVRVIDAGFDAATNMPFMVMELLKGDDLQKTVERGGPIAPGLVALYLRQAASALDKAHGVIDRGGKTTPIIHRDLKPENLFLSHREDGSPHLKILDFGIAKVLSEATKMSQQVKGTPLFMAFEQAAGQPISPRTDVWALGLIAFFLLTGKSYWRAAYTPGAGLTQLFGEVLALPLVPPSQRIAEMGWPDRVTPGFDAWFLRCVDREPSRRFASAGEAAYELTRVLDPAAAAADVGVSAAGAGLSAAGAAGMSGADAAPPSAIPATSGPLGAGTPPPSAGPGASRTFGSIAPLGQSVGLPPRTSPLPWVVAGVGLLGVAVGIGVWLRTPGNLGARTAAPPIASAEAALSAPTAPVVSVVAPPGVSVAATPEPTTSASAAPPARPLPSSKRAPPATTTTASPARKPGVYDER